MLKIIHVAGARPNFIKIASIIRACRETGKIESLLVHTGQHYDDNMSKTFFDDLDIPAPDINLEVGSQSHAQQTAEIIKRFEPVVLNERPDAVLVVGDVNSTIACALVAVKLGVKIIHVEAGLRSFDRAMPEEINRVVTDAISDILFVTGPSDIENLKREGVDSSKIHLVGNVMIDTLEHNKIRADKSNILNEMGLASQQYAVVTLHRASNVDDEVVLKGIVDALEEIQKEIKIVFPVHPRTYKNLEPNGLYARLESMSNIVVTEPLGYLDFLKLMSDAKIVITDSGGIQEETTMLAVPCLTVRENTEWSVTITEGTNILAGINPEGIVKGYHESLHSKRRISRPKSWDGKASQRIAQILLETL